VVAVDTLAEAQVLGLVNKPVVVVDHITVLLVVQSMKLVILAAQRCQVLAK
jgi:hypothetical protein